MKKTQERLTLKKLNIANLNVEQKNKLIGGGPTVQPTCASCEYCFTGMTIVKICK